MTRQRDAWEPLPVAGSPERSPLECTCCGRAHRSRLAAGPGGTGHRRWPLRSRCCGVLAGDVDSYGSCTGQDMETQQCCGGLRLRTAGQDGQLRDDDGAVTSTRATVTIAFSFRYTTLRPASMRSAGMPLSRNPCGFPARPWPLSMT